MALVAARPWVSIAGIARHAPQAKLAMSSGYIKLVAK